LGANSQARREVIGGWKLRGGKERLNEMKIEARSEELGRD